MDLDAYRDHWKGRFYALLARARATNQLYFLLNLHNGWGAHAPLSERQYASSLDFNAETNRAINTLVLDRIRGGRSELIPAHEALFVLQLSMEAKGVYAALRNFVSTCTGARTAREPWHQDEWSRSGNLLTGRIINNLVAELRAAGEADLADEFEINHVVETRMIRNAVAHGNFHLPAPETDQHWIFGEYQRLPGGHTVLATTRLTHDAFGSILGRFIAFRLGFFAATEQCKSELDGTTFSFTAPNQRNPEQILSCRYKRGVIEVRFQGTPLW